MEGAGGRKLYSPFFKLAKRHLKRPIKAESQLLNLLPITGKSGNFIIEENLSSILIVT